MQDATGNDNCLRFSVVGGDLSVAGWVLGDFLFEGIG
jgi:hypothetical protein